MDQATKDAFAELTRTVERGFAAVAEDIAEIRKDTTDIRRTVATKADIAALGTQMASIEQELKQIKRDLSALTNQVENIAGYRKEIDHAFDRIAAIERHLGIQPKLAA